MYLAVSGLHFGMLEFPSWLWHVGFSFLSRDQTWAPCTVAQSWPLDHQGSP